MANLIGQNLKNRYQVIELLGRGGMAEVYKVYDAHRGVHLAMKVLREDLAEDRVFLRRFQREAQNLAKLNHPNIVRFYGIEQDAHVAFILMEYVDGVSLRRKIFDAKGALPMQEILAILTSVCRALQYAHQQGIVHCDLKSANIMLDASGKVYLTDFGIARMSDAATATLVGVGTPAYMAPELVKGKDPSPQTDIYALGIVLYEMLTGGERPFIGENASITGTTAEKVRWEQVNINPVSMRKYNPEVPAALEALAFRCLEKEPHRRFESAMALLNSWQDGMDEKSEPMDRVPSKKTEADAKQQDVSKLVSIKGERQQTKPHANRPEKSKGSIEITTVLVALSLMISIGLIASMGGVNKQETISRLAQQTMQAYATGTAFANATEQDKQETSKEIASLEARAVKVPLTQDNIYFTLVEKEDEYLECQVIGTYYRDFILEAVFTNPGDVSHGWDYGVLFRDYGGNNQYRLQIDNGRDIELGNRVNEDMDAIFRKNSNLVHTSANERNKIKLIVKSGQGYLIMNDQFVSELDLSDRMVSGDLAICTDLYSDVGLTGNEIRVGPVQLWKFP